MFIFLSGALVRGLVLVNYDVQRNVTTQNRPFPILKHMETRLARVDHHNQPTSLIDLDGVQILNFDIFFHEIFHQNCSSKAIIE